MKKLYYWYGLIVGAVFLFDRITKYYAQQLKSVYYINPFLQLQTIHYNRGISWGMFNEQSTAVFFAVSALVICFCFIFAWYTYYCFSKGQGIVGHLLVLAGALSNVVDRLFYAGVIDFIQISYDGWHWPLFNIADASICLGVLIMFVGECCYRECAFDQ